MKNEFILIMIIGTVFSAASQVLLKKSANKSYKSQIYEYLNWRVILAYMIFFGVLFANTYAYTKVDMKYGAVIDSLGYIFVLLFSWLLLKERISKRKLIGNLVIMAGVILYTIPI